MAIFDVSETWVLAQQKEDNTIVDSGVLYYWNRETKYENYSELVDASLVIDIANPINSAYLVNSRDIIDRANDVANPGIGTFGGMQLLYYEDDPLTNPYNLSGFVITTVVGSIVVNKIKGI